MDICMLKTEALLEAISKSESAKAYIENENDYHQAILEVCYKRWQEEDDWSYADMTNYAKLTFGPFAQFMILIGKYNYQVCNGGHAQYVGNGYASGEGSHSFEHDSDSSLHQHMMYLFKKLELGNTALGRQIYSILNKFLEILQSSNHDNYDEYDRYDDLDTEYYKINDAWMQYLGELCKEKLAGQNKMAV